MTHKGTHKILAGLVVIALLVVGGAYVQSDIGPPEGTWACTSEWSYEREGATVACLSEAQATCTDNVLSISGVVSIGAAQWREKKEGTCFSSGEDLYGTWTAVETTPDNDAARQFEEETFAGRSLAIATNAVEHEHRVRVTSRTDTQLEAVDPSGRAVSCRRL